MSHDDDDFRSRRRRDDDDFDDRDRGGRRRFDDDDRRGGRDSRDLARAKVGGPGTALQIFGIFSLILSLLGLAIYLLNPDAVFKPMYEFMHGMQEKAQENQAKQLPPAPKVEVKKDAKEAPEAAKNQDAKEKEEPKIKVDVPKEAPPPNPFGNQPLPTYEEFKKQYMTSSIISSAVGAILGFLIMLGGSKMKALNGYGLAMTAAILALIPCTNSCCIIGFPLGLWAMITLMNADVKSAFR